MRRRHQEQPRPLTAADLEHLPDLEDALVRVAVARPGGMVRVTSMYEATQDALRRAGRPSLGLGTFTRLVRAAGFPRKTLRAGGRETRYFDGLDLREDDE